MVVSYVYDAWGKPISKTGSLADTLGEINPFRYRSYTYDCDIEQYYLQSRFFNPLQSRFINTDAFIGKVRIIRHNLYTYCENKPSKYVDTQGTEPYDLFDTELEAVLDFAEGYNNMAIEYAAMIYESEGKFFMRNPKVELITM